MLRLNCIVEGQTEETFMRNVLSPFLAHKELYVSVRRVETSRSKGKIYRGGLTSFLKVSNDIQRWLKEDNNKDVRFTTMFDLYRLPKDFPQFEESNKLQDPYAKVSKLEESFGESISEHRFIPYIQLHEFEALLFADVSKFDQMYLEHDTKIRNLEKVADKFGNPELIDQGDSTAPSKRIIKEIPEYASQKVSAGPIIAEKIGLDVLRSECAHFNEWISKLEALV